MDTKYSPENMRYKIAVNVKSMIKYLRKILEDLFCRNEEKNSTNTIYSKIIFGLNNQ